MSEDEKKTDESTAVADRDFSTAERTFIELTTTRQSYEIGRDKKALKGGDGPAPILLALARQHIDRAVGRDLLDGHVDEARTDLESARKFLSRLVEKASGTSDPLARVWLVPRDAQDVLLISLCLDDADRARSDAPDLLVFPFLRHGYRLGGHLLEMTAAVLKGDEKKDRFDEHAQALEELLKEDQTERGRILEHRLAMLRALSDGEEEAFVDATRAMLNRHAAFEVARNDASLRQYVSLFATGLVNLARSRDFSFELEHPRLWHSLLV